VTKQGDPTQQHCAAPGQCPGIEAHCDGPEDCPNEICCAPFDQGSMTYLAISCEPTCAGTLQEVIICHPPDGECPPNLTCVDSIYLPDTIGCLIETSASVSLASLMSGLSGKRRMKERSVVLASFQA
jgi:hypothetical protein